MSSFNTAEQSSVNSRNRVTDMQLNEGTLGSQRGRMLRRLAPHNLSACDIFSPTDGPHQ